MECRQPTPSVIARLMGLDTMPPQQPVHKQQRVLSEEYLRRTASIGVLEKRSSNEGRLFRMNFEDEQEFKDVFEVSETLVIDKHYNMSVQEGKGKSSLTEKEMAFARQRSMDGKHLSADGRLQNSKEFHDALEAFDSNRDLFLNYLQEPDSQFTKHLHDPQGVRSHPQLSHISVLRSLNPPNHRSTEICSKSERTTKRGDVIIPHEKLENGQVTHCHAGIGIDHSEKSLKLPLELNNGPFSIPTRIVVLKPNLGRAQKDERSIFSFSSCEGSQSGYGKKHKDVSRSESGELFIDMREQKNVVDELEPSRHSFRVSREIATEITRHMRQRMVAHSSEVSRSGIRVDDTSSNEFEGTVPFSSSSFDWKNRYQTSFSYPHGSFLAREAKKHLSERVKMTKRFQEDGIASRGSTLGEMLAVNDMETSPSNLDFKLAGKHGQCNQFGRKSGDANLGSPLGISSRDGWKDGCIRNFPRTKSLAAASSALHLESSKSQTRHESRDNDRFLMAMKTIKQRQNKSRMQDFDQQDDLKSRNSRSCCKISESFPCLDLENNHTEQETCTTPDELKNKLSGNDLSGQNLVVPNLAISSVMCLDSEDNLILQEMSVTPRDELKDNFEEDPDQKTFVAPNSSISIASTGMVADLEAGGNTEYVNVISGIHMELQSNQNGILLMKDGDSSSYVLDASIQKETSTEYPGEDFLPSHCPRLDPASPVNSEEACQPGPVLVLKPPSKEDTSPGSACFESVSTDVHGYDMQLQLLKMESSEEYSEGPGMAVSSDEDAEEVSLVLSKENKQLVELFRAEESRDFSYLVDVLVEAGCYGGYSEICFETWHSPECPINPTVFEALEKKYGQHPSWKRSERRLLFDRINSGLTEILQPCINMHTWAKSVTKRFSPRWSWEAIEEELWTSLVNQEKEASKESSKNLLGKEIRWLELGDDIDLVGIDIERLLIDELAAEVLSAECF